MGSNPDWVLPKTLKMAPTNLLLKKKLVREQIWGTTSRLTPCCSFDCSVAKGYGNGDRHRLMREVLYFTSLDFNFNLVSRKCSVKNWVKRRKIYCLFMNEYRPVYWHKQVESLAKLRLLPRLYYEALFPVLSRKCANIRTLVRAGLSK